MAATLSHLLPAGPLNYFPSDCLDEQKGQNLENPSHQNIPFSPGVSAGAGFSQCSLIFLEAEGLVSFTLTWKQLVISAFLSSVSPIMQEEAYYTQPPFQNLS